MEEGIFPPAQNVEVQKWLIYVAQIAFTLFFHMYGMRVLFYTYTVKQTLKSVKNVNYLLYKLHKHSRFMDRGHSSW